MLILGVSPTAMVEPGITTLAPRSSHVLMADTHIVIMVEGVMEKLS